MAKQALSGEAGAILDRAQRVLGPYFETLFKVVRRRADGDDRAPPLEPPTELLPFLQFKPQQAVALPAVRAALLRLVVQDSDLAKDVAAAHKSSVADIDVAAVFDAVAGGDEHVLETLASAAAASREEGWDAIILACAASVTALHAGREQGRAEQGRAADRAGRRETRQVQRAEERRREAEKKLETALAELSAQRERTRAKQRSINRLTKEQNRAGDQIDEAEKTRDDAAREADQWHARLEEAQAQHANAEGELRAEIDRLGRELAALRAAVVPDLSEPAAALEALASRLREMEAGLTAGASPSDEGSAPVGLAAARRSRSRPRSTRRESSPERTPLELPRGMRPDTPDLLRWAFRRRDLLVLVDGYNVTKQARRGWGGLGGDEQRQLLITHTRRAHRRNGADIRIVFDAAEPDRALGRRSQDGVDFEFSGGPTADDRIVEIVDSSDPRRPVLTVTSDRELQDRLARRGVQSVRSEVFLETLGVPER